MKLIIDRARWLLGEGFRDSRLLRFDILYAINDDPVLSNLEREAKLAKEFLKFNIGVEFIN